MAEPAQSRRWADFSDEESEDFSPSSRRSYCEVLRSGSPPAASPVRTPSPTPVSSRRDSPPPRFVPPHARPAPARRAASPHPPPPPPVAGPAPWQYVGGRKRRRAQVELPAWFIREGLPPDLAGACFNCLRHCHISRKCTFDTVCLRCRKEGHHAKDCEEPRAPQAPWQAGGAARPAVEARRAVDVERRGPVHTRIGPRGAAPAAPTRRVPAVSGPRVPVHQRIGDGAPPLPPPSSVGSAAPVARVPAHLRLGAREQPPLAPMEGPPLRRSAVEVEALREVGESSRQGARRAAPAARLDGRTRGDHAGDLGPPPGFDVVDSSPSPPPSPRRESDAGRLRMEVQGDAPPRREAVFIPRSAEIAAAEDALRWGLVAFMTGRRSRVPPREVLEAVERKIPRAGGNFSVHVHWPSDFLLVFGSRRIRDEVLTAGEIHGDGFSVRVSPWNRQLQATRCPLRFRVLLEMTGVPAHAWNRTTAAIVLGSSAWVERLGTSR
ncbi:unnamed protein product [Alopecurus aequalis]